VTIFQEGDFASLRRGRMHFVSAGRGTSIVLLHGWPGFWFDYRHVLPKAAGIGHCVAPDFFGFGLSDAIAGNPVDVADEDYFAADILELLDVLGIEQTVVVGHDIGSAVASSMARQAADRIIGLVLLNPTHPFIGEKRYAPEFQREAWYQSFHLLPLSEKLLDANRRNVELYLRHFYEHWAGRERVTPDEFAFVVDTYAASGRFTSSLAWYRARAARRIQPPDTTTAVVVPTIALWGDRDPMRPLDHREGFERAFPNSESRVLRGVGHFVPAESPDSIVQAIGTLVSS
jgi:pimeloyl-ACP methyl ester carboxylesterase